MNQKMKTSGGIIIALILGAVLCSSAHGLSSDTEILLKLLQKKGIVSKEEATALRKEMDEAKPPSEAPKPAPVVKKTDTEDKKSSDGKSISERVETLEKISESIKISGAVEVEAGYAKTEPAQGDSEDSSDIALATAELGIDAAITDGVEGHILFLYEDDEDVAVDEAFITITSDVAAGNLPWYASLGKLYVPFGSFESHFISDPLTLELGEARETAIVAGVEHDWMNVAFGIFNGDVNKTGKDDHIAKFVASGVFNLPEDTGFGFSAGVSYISDISDSNGLTDFIAEEFSTEEVESYVQGFSAFISLAFAEKFTVEAEYLGALDSYNENPDFKPQSWNLEIAYTPTDALELAARYAGSDKTLNFLPDTQYGGCITYSIFENTSLALEYMYGEFENDDQTHAITTLFAIEY